MKHDLQLPVSIWNLLPVWYYRNKGEVENTTLYSINVTYSPPTAIIAMEKRQFFQTSLVSTDWTILLLIVKEL